ncbi:hypothetical protein P691DRAFT_788616 [Macrolepiota fuliginosa MF-IS2]|uniref:Uncharacterized protein n=1 Tax=Macrolepiota fuliginosa MF-IS2 TaxID=1400762 RepID=A0A9P6BXF0_9AGAR|nr:hypothetical protein P691DRAFT_788616 [Macrolepiota fuliginosa MF-IS2]
MSPLPNGKYLIINLVSPQPTVGADNIDNSAIKPVIVDGGMRVWYLEGVGGGRYKLVLDENWYATTSADGENVEVHTSVDPGTRWELEDAEEGPGWYIIKLADTNTSWSAVQTRPKARADVGVRGGKVVLEPIRHPHLDPYQQWKFVPIFDD